MPDTLRPEYNPFIMGFTHDHGPLIVSLKQARETYGKLPSEYRLVSEKEGRKLKKTLNLDIGQVITTRLKQNRESLKKRVIDFYNGWHRSYEDEFNIQSAPFLNLNDPQKVLDTIQENQSRLVPLLNLDIRTEMIQDQLIRKDILNSIPPEQLPEKVQQILTKKIRQSHDLSRIGIFQKALARVQVHAVLQELSDTIGLTRHGFDKQLVDIYADHFAEALQRIDRVLPLESIGRLRTIKGQGIEFEFAPRDHTYLELGKATGDCTADKPTFQADQDVENIYWTVFPWILDRNYQILKVYYDGEFILKAHILPLYWTADPKHRMILAIDAIETVRAIRDDLASHRREELIDQRSRIFHGLLDQITAIAHRMGIDDVYAEKFSNTPWVRNEFAQLPEIFINVHQLIKLDELEDLWELAQSLGRESDQAGVRDIFMELQMKNTSLLPSSTQKMKGIKSFAVVQGDSADGIPIKRVVGI